MTIPCDKCPYKPYCIARINDPTIKGCGMALYMAGLIKREEIMVLHEVKDGDT